jgi:dihydrofolate reductase
MSDRKKIRFPSISFVVARSWPKNIIGCNNELPWRVKSDLSRFKKITQGHAVIMGRKTYESIGKPLPNRKNIVISRKKNENKDGLVWSTDENTALFIADVFSLLNKKKEVFIIGGGEIFDMYQKLFNKIHLTEIFDGERLVGDAFFKYQFDGEVWRTVDEQDHCKSDDDEYASRYTIYEKRKKIIREMWPEEFLTDSAERRKILKAIIKKYKEEKSIIVSEPDENIIQELMLEPIA